jgi:hypothetical protein
MPLGTHPILQILLMLSFRVSDEYLKKSVVEERSRSDWCWGKQSYAEQIQTPMFANIIVTEMRATGKE